jgi:hypothetical protein
VAAKAQRVAASHQAWVVTDAARRGRGHGTTLLGYVLDYLAAAGIRVVEANTLDRCSGCRPYEATRAFCERDGFIHIDTIGPLPGWQSGNPAQFTWSQSAQPKTPREIPRGDSTLSELGLAPPVPEVDDLREGLRLDEFEVAPLRQ